MCVQRTIAFFCASLLLSSSIAQIQITFPSRDGLIITADKYLVSERSPWILLCHQAGYSRGEYKETAVRLNQLGFNCLAIDQRSGSEVNAVKNETAALALKKGLATEYLDAEQDILAAIDYLYGLAKRPIAVLGSSYSASLALKVAVKNSKVKAVVSFSPGEYFGEKLNLKKVIVQLLLPVFITSSKEESADAAELFKAIASKNKTQFVPAGTGIHGSKALWSSTDDHQEYWDALEKFLRQVK